MDLPAPRSRGYDLEAVYHAHFAYVWTTLVRLGVDRADLEDGVHDVFVVAHRRRGDFDGSCALRTWLFGISRRVASDYRRRERRHRRRVDALASLSPPRVDPEAPPRHAEAARLLHRFLDDLDEGKRAVFVLTELEQMTSHEVARALGLNRNTVAARLRAARQAFERYGQRVRQPRLTPLLTAARQQEQPPPRARARVLGLVLTRVGQGSGAATAGSALGLGRVLEAIGLSLGIAAGGLGMIHLGAAHSSPPAEPAMDVSAELPAEPPAGLSAGPPVEPVAAVVRAAPSPSSPAPGLETPRDQPRALAIRDPRSPSPSSLAVGSPRARPDAPTPSASDDLLRQNQQLREARSALRQGDAARALELASAYERSFPGGLFGPEFALTRVRALCAQGRVTQAHTEATLLRHRFPDSAVIAAAEPGCPSAHDPAPSR